MKVQVFTNSSPARLRIYIIKLRLDVKNVYNNQKKNLLQDLEKRDHKQPLWNLQTSREGPKENIYTGNGFYFKYWQIEFFLIIENVS